MWGEIQTMKWMMEITIWNLRWVKLTTCSNMSRKWHSNEHFKILSLVSKHSLSFEFIFSNILQDVV